MNGEIKSKPLLSVIVPCYRVERYLDRCMTSIVNQTYSNLEIILVDDGSPDNTGRMCDNWAKRDSRIKVIHKQNEGLGFARNSGKNIAAGEWIAFVDSDDFINLNMYEKLMEVAISTNSDIAYCGHVKQMRDGSEIVIENFTKQTVFEKDALPGLSRGFFSPIPEAPKMLTMAVWHAVYRKKVTSQSFYSERVVGSEDAHFQICAMLASSRVVFIPNALITYCYNGESLSHTFLYEKFNRYKKLAEIVRSTYLEKGYDYRFDYYVFVMACGTIGHLMGSTVDEKVIKNYIRNVVKDSFWNECNLNSYKLSLPMKIMYKLLKCHSVMGTYICARVYNKLMDLTKGNKKLL